MGDLLRFGHCRLLAHIAELLGCLRLLWLHKVSELWLLLLLELRRLGWRLESLWSRLLLKLGLRLLHVLEWLHVDLGRCECTRLVSRCRRHHRHIKLLLLLLKGAVELGDLAGRFLAERVVELEPRDRLLMVWILAFGQNQLGGLVWHLALSFYLLGFLLDKPTDS